MYKIKLSKKVKKFLLRHQFLDEQFYRALVILSKNKSNNLDIKPLQGQKNNYRLRINKYRFLYKIIDEEIIIYFYDAGSRGDIY